MLFLLRLLTHQALDVYVIITFARGVRSPSQKIFYKKNKLQLYMGPDGSPDLFWFKIKNLANLVNL